MGHRHGGVPGKKKTEDRERCGGEQHSGGHTHTQNSTTRSLSLFSLFQVEGAVHAGGRGPSIWDAFSHTPGKTARGDTGDTADDFYHRFRADLVTAAALGARAFRFSLAWPRLFPNGTGEEPNPAGLAFYHDVLDACEEAGLEPWVTLYHWDLPLALQTAYGGWASPAIVPDFAAYAAAAFGAFGRRVRAWTTLNEPWTFCMMGYGSGVHAPGVSGRAWECVRHALLAHAAAAAAFKTSPAVHPAARLSLNLNANWAEPWDPANPADVAAAGRALDFDLGAFAAPLHSGAWPPAVAARRPPGLVPFSPAEAVALTAARPDFFALNYYTAAWVRDAPGAVGEQGQGVVDLERIQYDKTPGGRGPIGPAAESAWLFSAPWGLRKMLGHVAATYDPPSIAITENGCDAPGEDGAPWPALLNDTFRVDYYAAHVAAATAAAVEDGVPLEGYFAWSLLDNYECEWRRERGRDEGERRRERERAGGEASPAAVSSHPSLPSLSSSLLLFFRVRRLRQTVWPTPRGLRHPGPQH